MPAGGKPRVTIRDLVLLPCLGALGGGGVHSWVHRPPPSFLLLSCLCCLLFRSSFSPHQAGGASVPFSRELKADRCHPPLSMSSGVGWPSVGSWPLRPKRLLPVRNLVQACRGFTLPQRPTTLTGVPPKAGSQQHLLLLQEGPVLRWNLCGRWF